MASEYVAAIEDIQIVQKQALKSRHGGRMSNQFGSELKLATIFELPPGELISTMATAIAMMCACQLASSHDSAGGMALKDFAPRDGFNYLHNGWDLNLKSCLFQVCDSSRDVFLTAARNLDFMSVLSAEAIQSIIPTLLESLSRCADEDHLDRFQNMIKRLARCSEDSASKACEMQVKLNKLGRMAAELHATLEKKLGQNAATSATTSWVNVNEAFAEVTNVSIRDEITRLSQALDNAEKRLDRALDDVPEAWSIASQGAISAFTQVQSAIIAAALSTILKTAHSSPQNGALTRNGSGAAPVLFSDPACAAAFQTAHLFTTFFAFLGEDTKEPDWKKFEASHGTTGVDWLLRRLENEKKLAENTGSEASVKFQSALEDSIAVATEIMAHQRSSGLLSADKPSPDVVSKWKLSVKKAKNNVLSLSAALASMASINMQNPFVRAPDNLSRSDLSACTAQLSSTVHGVQISQYAAEASKANYDAASKKQEEAAQAMNIMKKRLQSLSDREKFDVNITAVLRDYVAVLADLSFQLGKMQRLYVFISALMKDIIFKRTEIIAEELSGASRSLRKTLSPRDVALQTIYTLILQSKAYFSLFRDGSSAYSIADRENFAPGIYLCEEFSRAASERGVDDSRKGSLRDNSERMTKNANDVAFKAQKETLEAFNERFDEVSGISRAVEDAVKRRGLAVDESFKQAIHSGSKMAEEGAKAVLAAFPSHVTTIEKSASGI